MLAYLLVALGGALGSVARFALSTLIARGAGTAFPWATIFVNVSGSLLIGLLAALFGSNSKLDSNSRAIAIHLLIVGICGGYTTFSTFSLQTLELIQSRQWIAAGANVLLSVTLCLIAVAAGFYFGSTLNPPASH